MMLLCVVSGLSPMLVVGSVVVVIEECRINDPPQPPPPIYLPPPYAMGGDTFSVSDVVVPLWC